MTELAYIIRHFEERFGAYKDRRIALYPGDYLEDILRSFGSSYNFFRILPPDSMEAPADAELVILTDFRHVKEPDYNAIHESCEKRNIPLFDAFGVDQIAVHRELEQQEYLSIPQWRELLSAYDVVSLFIPHVVSDYQEAEDRWILRRRFLILYRWLLSQKKTVVFFWEKEEQTALLQSENIQTDGKLYARKGTDRTGYLRLAEQYPGQRILHIGWGPVKDGIVPREYGMDSRIIKYYSFLYQVSVPQTEQGFFADKEALLEAVGRHDIISFDIFDTLLKRIVMYPRDVFEIVEERTGIAGFSDARCEIQAADPELSLDGIYGKLEERCGYDRRTLEMLRAAELKTESEVILPRESMVAVFNRAKALHKTVVLTSDMYLDAGFIEGLLRKCGITGYSALHLSCRSGILKQEGLFEELTRCGTEGKRILHIGDNHYSDYLSAREFGLDAFLVPSPLELAEKNGYRTAIGLCRSLADRKLLGLGIAMGFDDPFAQHGDALIADMIVAPLAAGYLQWVCGRLAAGDYHCFLLSSRDGYILRETYGRLQKMFPDRLPPGRYFYTGRHAAFLTVMDDFELVKYFGNLGIYGDDVPRLFRRLFCLRGDELQPYRGESVEEYYRMHEGQIRALAQKCREGYGKYWSREGLQGKKCAVMDFISEGNCQRMLEKHITGEQDGLYVGIPEYSNRYARNIDYYLDQDLIDYDTLMKLEVYFTSPEPALDRIGEDGGPVFDPEVRKPEAMERIQKMHRLVQSWLDAYLDRLFDPKDTFCKDLIFELCRSVNDYNADNLYYDDMAGQEIETIS